MLMRSLRHNDIWQWDSTDPFVRADRALGRSTQGDLRPPHMYPWRSGARPNLRRECSDQACGALHWPGLPCRQDAFAGCLAVLEDQLDGLLPLAG